MVVTGGARLRRCQAPGPNAMEEAAVMVALP